MDRRPPGSPVPGILQARVLEGVAISFSRGSSSPRDQTHISCISCIGKWTLPLCHLGHPYWIRAGPKYESVLIRDREYTEKRFIRRQRQRTEGYCHKPGEKLEPPEAERGRIFPRNFRRNVILLIPVSWASRPQLWETINFCCFKPCNLWSFVTEARKIDKGVWSLVSFTSLNSC